MKRFVPLSTLVLLLILFSAILLYGEDTVRFLGVVDGNTLKVRCKGIEESVRLIGIDAPESRINKKARNDAQRSGEDLKTIIAMGREATNYVKTLIKPGDTVKMEFDVQKRDKYGRLLGYVYLSDRAMLMRRSPLCQYS
jgi:micrococcal nuclease